MRAIIPRRVFERLLGLRKKKNIFKTFKCHNENNYMNLPTRGSLKTGGITDKKVQPSSHLRTLENTTKTHQNECVRFFFF